MNYDFFASRSDKLRLLEFIFDETDIRLFDFYSRYETPIVEYSSANQIDEVFDLENGGQFSVLFQLWSPRFGREILFERLPLDPDRCEGKTYRFASRGLGLIQLYFGGVAKEVLNYSHIGHISEKRAIASDELLTINDRSDQWNWKEIQKSSRQLKYWIHKKMSVNKIGSLGVMPGADALDRQGVKMSYFIRD